MGGGSSVQVDNESSDEDDMIFKKYLSDKKKMGYFNCRHLILMFYPYFRF